MHIGISSWSELVLQSVGAVISTTTRKKCQINVRDDFMCILVYVSGLLEHLGT